jgi:hypothetical protein
MGATETYENVIPEQLRNYCKKRSWREEVNNVCRVFNCVSPLCDPSALIRFGRKLPQATLLLLSFFVIVRDHHMLATAGVTNRSNYKEREPRIKLMVRLSHFWIC